MIHIEDYEREHLKDLVYLQEDIELMRIAVQADINQRKPAQIVVIDQDRMLHKQRNESKINALPF